MKNVYIFSGLGTDERVFKFLEFKNVNVKYIDWQETNAKSLNIYASRLLHQIKSPKPILIGLSFGGIVATEVAKHIETEKVIFIASAKQRMKFHFIIELQAN